MTDEMQVREAHDSNQLRTLPISKMVKEACAAVFAEMQGHAPTEQYEDGYSDACAACGDRAGRGAQKYHDSYRATVEAQISAMTAPSPAVLEPNHNLATGERENQETDDTYFEASPVLDPVTVEACAKVADKVAGDWQEDSDTYAAQDNYTRACVSANHRSGAEEVAIAIRALTDQPRNAEAVAWQARSLRGGIWRHCDRPHSNPEYEYRPLYASPPNPQEAFDK